MSLGLFYFIFVLLFVQNLTQGCEVTIMIREIGVAVQDRSKHLLLRP